MQKFTVLDKKSFFCKFEGADYKYDHVFLLQPKTNPNRTFLVPNLKTFCFAQKFTF